MLILFKTNEPVRKLVRHQCRCIFLIIHQTTTATLLAIGINETQTNLHVIWRILPTVQFHQLLAFQGKSERSQSYDITWHLFVWISYVHTKHKAHTWWFYINSSSTKCSVLLTKYNFVWHFPCRSATTTTFHTISMFTIRLDADNLYHSIYDLWS